MSTAPVDIDARDETGMVPEAVANRLTVHNVLEWRKKTVMPTGTAPACSSDMFKSPVRHLACRITHTVHPTICGYRRPKEDRIFVIGP
jgi:hypothetical protein